MSASILRRWRFMWAAIVSDLHILKTADALGYAEKNFWRYRDSPPAGFRKICRLALDLELTDEQIVKMVRIAGGAA